MKKSVIIIGGGVAGMSAAHELVERGFEVEIYEKQKKYVGGKARSVDVPDSAKGGKKPLPGEHGFRFFPGFYKHITHTMKRIPYPGNRRGVYDNLISTDRMVMGREEMEEIVSLVNFPKSLKDLKVMFNALRNANTTLTKEDTEDFAGVMWKLMTSCKQRRYNEFERVSWWEFSGAEAHGAAYRKFFVGGLTHTLVAAQARLISTKTGGDILTQLVYQMTNPFKKTDRVLNAPTNEAWLHPWRDYLLSQGVKYHHGHTCTQLTPRLSPNTRRPYLESVSFTTDSGERVEVKGDYFVSAMPVEALAKVLDSPMLRADPSLKMICTLAESVNWMNGIQFYLKEDLKIARGHVMIIDSPWAVTAISQPQFWGKVDLSQYGDGTVKGIISVDVSNWTSIGMNGKTAQQCTFQELIQEVWCQLSEGLIKDGEKILQKELLLDCYIDEDIQILPEVLKENPDAATYDVKLIEDCKDFKAWSKQRAVEIERAAEKHRIKKQQMINQGSNTLIKEEATAGAETEFPILTSNAEPLLVNRINTWGLRPQAHTVIDNFLLTGDYVRTNTDLATMEGANESARRAVNAIIKKSGSNARLCKVWDLHEPILLAPFRWLDHYRWKRGIPWHSDYHWILRLVHFLIVLGTKILHLGKRKKQ